MTSDYRIDKHKQNNKSDKMVLFGYNVNIKKPRHIPISLEPESLPLDKLPPPSKAEQKGGFKIVRPLIEDEKILPEEVFAKCKPETN